jgi:hypothetical protein
LANIRIYKGGKAIIFSGKIFTWIFLADGHEVVILIPNIVKADNHAIDRVRNFASDPRAIAKKIFGF